MRSGGEIESLNYGKLYAKLFHGSLYGAGPLPLTLMSYIVSHQVPLNKSDKTCPLVVQLNPAELSNTIGKVTVEEVKETIRFLESPDADSDTQAEEGRRIVHLNQWWYRVVNGRYYRKMMDEEQRRESNARASRKYREKGKKVGRVWEPNTAAARRADAHTDGGEKGKEL